MNRRRKCNSCGAKQSKALCVVCMRQLPSKLQKWACDAMRNRFDTVEHANRFSMAVAWLEGMDAFWNRIMEGVTDDTPADI